MQGRARRNHSPAQNERGYAMVAAVAAIALFALIAASMVQRTGSGVERVQATTDRARLGAAADTALAMALSGLLNPDRAFRWSIDGRDRPLDIDGLRATVRIEDERGKVPLALLDEELAEHVVAVLGLSGERAAVARDSLLDWIDQDDDPRPDGAESVYYAPQGIAPRNGIPHSFDELTRVRGFDARLTGQLARFATLHFGSGPFDARYAQPLAIDVMQGGGIAGPASIARQRELAGQRPAIELDADTDLAGRSLSIIAQVRGANGARARRAMVVELTGAQERPYIVRTYD